MFMETSTLNPLIESLTIEITTRKREATLDGIVGNENS
jgi:hypothetical protein